MKQAIKSTIAIAATTAAIAGVAALPSLVSAWGDTYINQDGTKGRPSYTIDQINNGALGKNCKKEDTACVEAGRADGTYPGTIMFNTIYGEGSVIGDEKNFVGARECYVDGTRCLDATTKANPTPTTQWQGNDITVEDGKTYAIRLYVHNNNPNGTDAIAKNTRVSFNIPNGTATSFEVNGFIKSDNATPNKYWDHVNIKSKDGIPFYLDYIEGSARLNNETTQKEAELKGDTDNAGWQLSDDIVKAASVDGVLIGSSALDGNVPGCYSYANYVTIQVKAIFDYEYTVDKKVRLQGDADRTWKDSVDAKVGDKVEFRIEYKNTSDKDQNNVAIKDILPANLKYVAGTTVIKNDNHKNGAKVLQDDIVANGIDIGSYAPTANAYLYITTEVVDENLACGNNTLINWAQAGISQKTIQNSASVKLNKYCEGTPTETPKELPNTGPAAVVGGAIATGSVVTAAGYYIASRRQLR